MNATTPAARLPRRRDILLLLGGALGAGLAGCAALPTDGPVTESDPGEPIADQLVQTADGPVDGATPEEIVQGFLRACVAGFSDDFMTARTFLLGSATTSWSADKAVRIYAGSSAPVVTRKEDGSVSVTAQAIAQVDATGAYSQAAEGATHAAAFSLSTDADGQWRIVTLPDGILLSASAFASSYVGQRLHFLTADRRRFLPDLRWYPRRKLATHLVSGLLAGPSSWLEGSAVTAVPTGTALSMAGVEIDEGRAVVVLSDEALTASEADRALICAQIEATLVQLATVQEVTVQAEGSALATPANLPDLAPDPGDVVGMSRGDVVRRSGSSLTTVAEAQDLGPGEARHPVLGADGTVFALVGGDLVRGAQDGGLPTLLLQAGSLLAPVADRHGWVWTGSGSRLMAVGPAGSVSYLAVDWLEDGISAFDLAADSERLVIGHGTGETAVLDVAAIRRDEEGMPTALGAPLRVDDEGVLDVAWTDPTTVAALAPAQAGTSPEIRLLSISGTSSSLVGVEGAQLIAGNRSNGLVVLTTPEGHVWQRSGATWRVLADDLADASYPTT